MKGGEWMKEEECTTFAYFFELNSGDMFIKNTVNNIGIVEGRIYLKIKLDDVTVSMTGKTINAVDIVTGEGIEVADDTPVTKVRTIKLKGE